MDDRNERTIFIAGFIPESITLADIYELVGACGPVEEIRWPRINSRQRNFAFAIFTDVQAAREAISRLDGAILGGKAITVRPARPRKEAKA
jgi:RNA recognition motif-containing protein